MRSARLKYLGTSAVVPNLQWVWKRAGRKATPVTWWKEVGNAKGWLRFVAGSTKPTKDARLMPWIPSLFLQWGPPTMSNARGVKLEDYCMVGIDRGTCTLWFQWFSKPDFLAVETWMCAFLRIDCCDLPVCRCGHLNSVASKAWKRQSGIDSNNKPKRLCQQLSWLFGLLCFEHSFCCKVYQC